MFTELPFYKEKKNIFLLFCCCWCLNFIFPFFHFVLYENRHSTLKYLTSFSMTFKTLSYFLLFYQFFLTYFPIQIVHAYLNRTRICCTIFHSYIIALVSSKKKCILFIHSLFLRVEIRLKWNYDEKMSALPLEKYFLMCEQNAVRIHFISRLNLCCVGP